MNPNEHELKEVGLSSGIGMIGKKHVCLIRQDGITLTAYKKDVPGNSEFTSFNNFDFQIKDDKEIIFIINKKEKKFKSDTTTKRNELYNDLSKVYEIFKGKQSLPVLYSRTKSAQETAFLNKPDNERINAHLNLLPLLYKGLSEKFGHFKEKMNKMKGTKEDFTDLYYEMKGFIDEFGEQSDAIVSTLNKIDKNVESFKRNHLPKNSTYMSNDKQDEFLTSRSRNRSNTLLPTTLIIEKPVESLTYSINHDLVTEKRKQLEKQIRIQLQKEKEEMIKPPFSNNNFSYDKSNEIIKAKEVLIKNLERIELMKELNTRTFTLISNEKFSYNPDMKIVEEKQRIVINDLTLKLKQEKILSPKQIYQANQFSITESKEIVDNKMKAFEEVIRLRIYEEIKKKTKEICYTDDIFIKPNQVVTEAKQKVIETALMIKFQEELKSKPKDFDHIQSFTINESTDLVNQKKLILEEAIKLKTYQDIKNTNKEKINADNFTINESTEVIEKKNTLFANIITQKVIQDIREVPKTIIQSDSFCVAESQDLIQSKNTKFEVDLRLKFMKELLSQPKIVSLADEFTITESTEVVEKKKNILSDLIILQTKKEILDQPKVITKPHNFTILESIDLVNQKNQNIMKLITSKVQQDYLERPKEITTTSMSFDVSPNVVEVKNKTLAAQLRIAFNQELLTQPKVIESNAFSIDESHEIIETKSRIFEEQLTIKFKEQLLNKPKEIESNAFSIDESHEIIETKSRRFENQLTIKFREQLLNKPKEIESNAFSIDESHEIIETKSRIFEEQLTIKFKEQLLNKPKKIESSSFTIQESENIIQDKTLAIEHYMRLKINEEITNKPKEIVQAINFDIEEASNVIEIKNKAFEELLRIKFIDEINQEKEKENEEDQLKQTQKYLSYEISSDSFLIEETVNKAQREEQLKIDFNQTIINKPKDIILTDSFSIISLFETSYNTLKYQKSLRKNSKLIMNGSESFEKPRERNNSYTFPSRNQLIHSLKIPNDFIKYMVLESNTVTCELPISMYEPITMLQRQCEKMFNSHYLSEANRIKNKADKFCLIVAFVLGELSLGLNRFMKPLKPNIGETYEYIDNELKYRFFAEEVSTSPHISAYFGQSADFTIIGNTNQYFLYNPYDNSFEKYELNSPIITLSEEQDQFKYTLPATIFRTNNDFTGIQYNGIIKITDEKNKGNYVDIDMSLNVIEGAIIVNDKKVYSLYGSLTDFVKATDIKGTTSKIIWQSSEEEYLHNSLETKNYHMPKGSYNLNHADDELKKILPMTDSRRRKDLKKYEKGKINQALEYQRLNNSMQTQKNDQFVSKHFRKTEFKEYIYNNTYWTTDIDNL